MSENNAHLLVQTSSVLLAQQAHVCAHVRSQVKMLRQAQSVFCCFLFEFCNVTLNYSCCVNLGQNEPHLNVLSKPASIIHHKLSLKLFLSLFGESLEFKERQYSLIKRRLKN